MLLLSSSKRLALERQKAILLLRLQISWRASFATLCDGTALHSQSHAEASKRLARGPAARLS
eukprot:6187169-Pleurochrysis_carterae.AAC.3